MGLETERLCHPLPGRISLQPLWPWSSTHRLGLWFDSHGGLAKPVWIGGHKAWRSELFVGVVAGRMDQGSKLNRGRGPEADAAGAVPPRVAITARPTPTPQFLRLARRAAVGNKTPGLRGHPVSGFGSQEPSCSPESCPWLWTLPSGAQEHASCSPGRSLQQPGAGTFLMVKSRLSGSVSALKEGSGSIWKKPQWAWGFALATLLSGFAALEGS